MKLVVASDIHGSAFYCNKLIERYKKEKADKLILLGDILYHGPRNDLPKDYSPKEVIQMLNDLKEDILCVRGNCDTEVDQMVLEFPILAQYSILYIGDRMIYMTHGHNYNKDSLPPMKCGDILLHGHTHVPVCEEINDKKIMYLNPGSVSIPKKNTKNSYMIILDDRCVWKDLEGNAYMEFKF